MMSEHVDFTMLCNTMITYFFCSVIDRLFSVIDRLFHNKQERIELLNLLQNIILSTCQFRFQASKNTMDAIFSLLNQGDVLLAVFCAFSKAFDCVRQHTFGKIVHVRFPKFNTKLVKKLLIKSNTSCKEFRTGPN